MSLTDWDGSLEDPPPTPDGPDELDLEPVDDEVAAEATDEGGEDTAEVDEAAVESLIGGKWKNTDALLESYNELQRKMHEQAELLANMQQPVDDDEDDPFGLWNTALDNDDAEKLAEIVIQQPQRAQEVIEWVQQNPDQFGVQGEQVLSALFGLWNQHDAMRAQGWIADQRLREREAQWQEQQAPLHEAHATQMMNAAIHRADTELPNFREYWPKIMERINRPEVQRLIQGDLDSYRTDPNKSYALIEAAMSQIALEEWKANARQTAADSNTESGTTVKKPRTQARSSVSAPAPDEVRDLFPAGSFRQE